MTRLEELTLKLADGLLSDAEVAELERLLADGDAGQHCRLLDLEAGLQALGYEPDVTAATLSRIETLLPDVERDVLRAVVACRPPWRRHGFFAWFRGVRNRWLAGMAAIVAAGFLLALCLSALRQPAVPSTPAGEIVELNGELEITSPDGQSRAAALGQKVLPGETLRTGKDTSSATVVFPDTTRLELRSATAVRLDENPTSASRRIIFSTGTLRAEAPPSTEHPMLVVTAPQAEIRGRDTRFLVSATTSEATRVDLEAGQVQVATAAGVVDVPAGSWFVAKPVDEPVAVQPLPRRLTEPRRALGHAWHQLIDFVPDEDTVLVASPRKIIYVDPAGKESGHTLFDRTGETGAMAVARDRRTVALRRDRTGDILLWDVVSRKMKTSLPTAGIPANLLALGPDGHLLALATRDTNQPPIITLWDTAAEQARRQLTAPVKGIVSLAIAPDSKLVAAGTETIDKRAPAKEIYLWDALTGEVITVLRGHRLVATSLAFSADGRWLASAGHDGRVCLWDVPGRRLERTIEGHERPLTCLAFAPDGARLAGGTTNGEVWLWKPGSGEVVLRIEAGTTPVRSLAFSPDGRTLATLLFAAGGHLWDLPADRPR
jgi:sugar lactone lactonase YvrE